MGWVIQQLFDNLHSFKITINSTIPIGPFYKGSSFNLYKVHPHSRHTSFLVTLMDRTLSTMAASSSLGFSYQKITAQLNEKAVEPISS